MVRVYATATTEIWHDKQADEFYAYTGDKLLRVCPSLGMAHEIVAGY